MLHREIAIEHVAPWLVSGASGLYILARARRLSEAQPSHDPLSHFLRGQSDMIFMLCGSQLVWYVTRRRRRRLRDLARSKGTWGPTTQAMHQLRQVFTALIIGTGLLARKAAAAKTPGLAGLAQRLHSIARDGAGVLADLDELCTDDMVAVKQPGYGAALERNGWQ
jgi:hypothetical protein